MSEDRNQQRQCPNCGAQVRAGESFCVSCGTRLDAQEQFTRQRGAAATQGGVDASPFDRLVDWFKRDFMGVGVRTERSPQIRGEQSAASQNSTERRTDTPRSIERQPHPTSAQYEQDWLHNLTVGLAPEDALRHATDYMMAYQGEKSFTVADMSEISVTFRNYRFPSAAITILLLVPSILYLIAANANVDWTFSGLIFFVLLFPPLIYLVGAGRHVYSGVAVIPVRGGCRIRISGESQLGYERLRTWAGALPPPDIADEPDGDQQDNGLEESPK